ncbi:hypothetical protein ACWF94_37460 [Streptomyces sp. NPDC055078]
MAYRPDDLRAMSPRDRLAALRAMTREERAELDNQMAEARRAAEARYGPAKPWTPEPPCVQLED